MTETEKLVRVQRLVLYIKIIAGAGLLLGLFSLYKGCENSRTRLAESSRMQAEADSLKKALANSYEGMAAVRKSYESRIAFTDQKRAIAAHKTDSLGKLLGNSQIRIKQLLNERIGIIEGPMDPDRVEVGQNYIRNCDSAFGLLPVLGDQITYYKDQIAFNDTLNKVELAIRDSALAIEKRHSDTLQSRADHLANTAERDKPRNRIYLTGTIWSDLDRHGAGGGFTLVTKKQKVWGAKVGVFNKQLFYQADFGLLLSLRKK